MMKRIGIDIDDTITDTCTYLTKYVAEYFGVEKSYLIENHIYYFKLPEEFKSREKEFGMNTFEKHLLEIPIKPFAKEVINELKEDGNEIIIITARDKDTYKEPLLSTKKQLEHLGIKYDEIICTNNKRKACLDKKIDIFIDDSMRNIEKTIDVVKETYLFTSPYNKDFDVPFKRVNDWKEIYELLKSIE